MLDEALGKMNKEQRDSLEDILESSQSLLDLINDVSLWQDAYPGVKK
jgi:signal transduction histidine kinase